MGCGGDCPIKTCGGCGVILDARYAICPVCALKRELAELKQRIVDHEYKHYRESCKKRGET